MFSLIIEIQSGIVKGSLIFKKKDSENPQITFTTIKIIQRKEHTEGAYLIKLMLKAVAEVAEEISHKTNHLKSIHYVFSSPWVVSHLKTVKVDFEKDTEITEKTVNEIIDKDYKDLISNSTDLVCIDRKVYEIKLNGYVVTNYKKRKAKNLQMSFAYTVGSTATLKKVHAVFSHFISAKIEIDQPASLLLSLAMHSSDYILLDIHGELTDVVIVKMGLPFYTYSFDYGISTLSRKLQSTMKNSANTVDSMLSLLYASKLEENEEKRLSKIIEPIISGWYAGFRKSLESLNDRFHIDFHMPRTLYLFANEHSEVFRKALVEGSKDRFNLSIEVLENPSPMYMLALKDML